MFCKEIFNVIGNLSKFNIKRFDLNLLVVFVELWETRSVTRTSERLSLTQSAVSHALKRLRSALNDELFLQSRSGLQPTPGAERCIGPIKRAIEEIGSTLCAEIRFDPATAQREFSIAIGEIVELTIAPLLTKMIAQEAPGIRLKFRPMPENSMANEMLENGDLQIVLSTREIKGAQIQNEILTNLSLVSMLSKKMLPDGETLSLDAYLSIPHVVIHPIDHRGSAVDLVLAENGLKRPVGAVVQNYMVMAMVAAQCGFVCHLPSLLAEQFCDILDLAIYDPPISIPPSKLIVTRHAKFQSDPGGSWLLQKIKEVINK